MCTTVGGIYASVNEQVRVACKNIKLLNVIVVS